jgi:hypothetical protein
VVPAGSCELLFDMNMKPREKRQLRKKTQQEKEAYLGLRRKGGACPEHRASKRAVHTPHSWFIIGYLLTITFT